MPDDSTVEPLCWTDYRGRVWPLVTSPHRLKFKIKSHAALREHVFHRDGFKCVRCDARALNIPADYCGRYTLQTNTLVRGRWSDVLILDHVLTMTAGGPHRIENFQTLCETCNRRKIPEDIAAATAHRRELTHA